LSTTIGAITGPVFGVGVGVLPFFSRVLPLASGVFGLMMTGGGGGVTSLKYFRVKSERMFCLSETFAFNWKEASCGMAKMMSPVMLVNPYEPDFANGPLIVTFPLTVFSVTFGLLTRSS